MYFTLGNTLISSNILNGITSVPYTLISSNIVNGVTSVPYTLISSNILNGITSVPYTLISSNILNGVTSVPYFQPTNQWSAFHLKQSHHQLLLFDWSQYVTVFHMIKVKWMVTWCGHEWDQMLVYYQIFLFIFLNRPTTNILF